MNKKICVFCASSAKVDKKYFDATVSFAHDAIKNSYDIIYGGGALGLMGTLANAALEEGGNVIGIMPEFMKAVEWNHNGLSELIIVDDMRERKKQLIERADIIVALPGGCGTLEELFEAISLKRLGKITHPIIILNYDGFYDSLETLLEHMIAEKFMVEKHRPIWAFVKTPEEIVPAIRSSAEWSADAIQFAVV
ncbi:MAG: TIGR00730 family Rossman fold protein [Prevotellaceae bacterium]|jgi:uncharacterized protein (TIGR00730 family)|nr:TIGR00730 family Rossman fold protein [Prevotellaceae bacterium]